MDDKPLYSLWRNNDIYAGFWIRFAAGLLDLLILLPFGGLIIYINSFNRFNCIYLYVPQFLIMIFYQVYLVKRYGGTLGKLAVGIKVIKLNGDAVDWEAAIYRYIVSIVLSIISFMITVSSVLSISDEQFMSVPLIQRNGELLKGNPVYNYYMLISFLWVLSEIIVLLASDKKRAIHDLIGDTVVIREEYLKVLINHQKTTVSE